MSTTTPASATDMSSSTTSGPTATLDIFQSGDVPQDDEVVLQGQVDGGFSGGAAGSASSSSLGGAPPGFNTLDEPIKETFLRDVSAVGNKFYHVLYPVERTSLLKHWDLWGPLILCTFMATILQGHDDVDGNDGDGGPQFAEVFVIVWIGALVVTLNTKLLGGHISFFQSVCVLGYCLLPLTMSLVVCRIILFAAAQTTILFFMRCVTVLIGFIWASYASMQFLGDCQPEKRKALAAYPMFLFYFLIAWMVVSHSN